MKIKVQALLLVVVLMFAMTSCGEKSIELTEDNYNDYLKFDLHAEGNTKSERGEYYPLGYSYESVRCYGNVEGLSQFTYEDVYITVRISFTLSSSYLVKNGYSVSGDDYENLEQSIESQFKLRADGSADVDFSGDVEEIAGRSGVFAPDILKINGYSIVDVSGTVSPV